MSKRMTDTDKWKKPFLKALPAEYKLFWLYLLDECDHAGIWHVELELAEMRLGIKLSHQKIRGFFKERIVEFDNETKWFLPDFIKFQYNELEEKNRAHKSVIDRLKKYSLYKENLTTIKPLPRPLQGCKDMDKEQDKDIGGVGEIGIVLGQWSTKPKLENLPIDVPAHIADVAKLRLYSTRSITLTNQQIGAMWLVFKTLKLDGNNFYQSIERVYDHFTNWIKDQPFNENDKGKKSSLPGKPIINA